jgi:hypothetical protein
MRHALADRLVEVEWSGCDGVTGAHDHDRLVAAAIGDLIVEAPLLSPRISTVASTQTGFSRHSFDKSCLWSPSFLARADLLCP